MLAGLPDHPANRIADLLPWDWKPAAIPTACLIEPISHPSVKPLRPWPPPDAYSFVAYDPGGVERAHLQADADATSWLITRLVRGRRNTMLAGLSDIDRAALVASIRDMHQSVYGVPVFIE